MAAAGPAGERKNEMSTVRANLRILRSAWRSALVAALCFAPLSAGPAPAAERSDVVLEPSPDDPAWKRRVEGSHEYLSNRVEALSQRLDSFFGGERAYEESTRSSLRLGGGVRWEEAGEFNWVSRVRLKLDLPETRRRFHLLLESDLEEEVGDDGDIAARQAVESQADTENYNAALRYILYALGDWRVTTDAGVRLEWPPDPFARLRIRRSFELGRWNLRATERVFWFVSDGLGETTSLDLETAVGGDQQHLFAVTAQATWREEENGLALFTGTSFFQRLPGERALVYAVGLSGGTSPVLRREQYQASVRFRSRLFLPWLFYELEPRTVWPREDNFKPASSFFLRLEAFFGSDYL
jgi:hypothetical protein